LSIYLTLYLLFSSFTGFSQAVTVTQTPEILLSSERINVTINCKHDDSNHYQIYWYRQVRDGGLTYIGYSPGANSKELEKGFESKFDIIRPDIYHSSLEIASLTSEDTAVYFCASTLCSGSNTQYFGNGTKLTVLGKNSEIQYHLHIHNPSKEETVEKKRVTLVCLATDFYPDHIEITWKINGKNRSNGVKTDDYATNNTKTYSISSRLRLTPREWFNPENTFTCAAKFYKGNGSETVIHEKHISGKDGRFIKTFCKSVCH
ncbi:immunoglobulin lambda-1 light chain-like, partial [Acipenser oxyrinchus oxyrinchus]